MQIVLNRNYVTVILFALCPWRKPMGYSTEFKLRVLKHARMGISPILVVAHLKRVPKQTIYRWMELERKFGKNGLENRSPGAKPQQINVTFEKFIL